MLKIRKIPVECVGCTAGAVGDGWTSVDGCTPSPVHPTGGLGWKITYFSIFPNMLKQNTSIIFLFILVWESAEKLGSFWKNILSPVWNLGLKLALQNAEHFLELKWFSSCHYGSLKKKTTRVLKAFTYIYSYCTSCIRDRHRMYQVLNMLFSTQI